MRVRFAQNREIPGDGWRFRGLAGLADLAGFGAYATIRVGSSGADVLKAQGMLKARGYDLPLSGHFDAVSTLPAVMDFQRKNGLEPDGIIGQLTWAKLAPASSPAPAPRPLAPQPEPVGFAFEPWMVVGGVGLVALAVLWPRSKRKS